MIDIYKIGLELYDNIDKNSGLYEYGLIKKSVENLFSNKKVLIILNGKLTDSDNTLYNTMKNYDYRIFIASDIIALEENVNIIKNCDVLLHQSPKTIKNIDIRQMYSYVPELFFTENKQKPQDNYLFFGGGVRDKEYEILSYLSYGKSKMLLKTNSNDNRLPYDKYLEELSKHKYSLVISRSKYDEVGWVTSRFVEAISNWVYPIVDEQYDKYGHFNFDKVNICNFEKRIHHLDNCESDRISAILKCRKVLAKNANKFKDIIEELINE